MGPIEAGRLFVEDTFPESLCAFVAGSPLRDDATSTSDLDIVVISSREDAPFRASYIAHGWPIEAFVHTVESYRRWAIADGKRNRPSLCTMAVEGVVIRETDGMAEQIRAVAREILDSGPTPLSVKELEQRRYGLTDYLDDFVGCDRPDECLFIATALAAAATELILLLNGQWIGAGKWIPRALHRHDPARADELGEALLAYTRNDNTRPLITFAEMALNLAGGRLFEGYYSRGT